MKVISAVLGIFLLALSTVEGRLEYSLQCTAEEVGIRWPSYVNSANYYVCQREGGNQLMISCPNGNLFSFVLQVCTSPEQYIPPPALDILPISAPLWAGSISSDESSPFIMGLPKPLKQKEPMPEAPYLPEESNAPESLATESSALPESDDVDLSTISPPAPQSPPKPAGAKPPMPSKPKPKPVKPSKPKAPMPPTPAPTPPVLKLSKKAPKPPAKKKTAPMPMRKPATN